MTPVLALLILLAAGCGPDPGRIAIDRTSFFAPDAPGPFRVFRRPLEQGRGTLYLPSSSATSIS